MSLSRGPSWHRGSFPSSTFLPVASMVLAPLAEFTWLPVAPELHSIGFCGRPLSTRESRDFDRLIERGNEGDRVHERAAESPVIVHHREPGSRMTSRYARQTRE
jgi:hypothetical protein